MSTDRTNTDLDTRRRRLRFRAWHRGTREMDLLMGRFADSELGVLPEAEIDDLELLMEAPDRDVFSWLTGELALPGNYDTPVFRRLRAFQHARCTDPLRPAAGRHEEDTVSLPK